MHILLVATAFNSLTQRVHAELRDRGHTVTVELALPGVPLADTVRRHTPHLVLAPMLKTAIPREVWSAYPCLVVHPGPVGDRGPSSLDWAVLEGATRWGVTVFQAEDEMDAGAVWASVACPVPPVSKSDLYRGEIADAALAAVLLAVERFASGTYTPLAQGPARSRPYLDQSVRRIDWDTDATWTVVRKLRSADSQPGVLDVLLGEEWYLHGGHPEEGLRGAPGELLATRAGAICRATRDGAVWIPELRRRRVPGQPRPVKLPAVRALGGRLPPLPELPVAPDAPWPAWTDIRYREEGGVGFLSFAFPGGAMSTTQCRRLLAAYRDACARPTSVLVLGGWRDFFSNGIHLGVIEAADDPAAESWANINAIDDLVEAVLRTTGRLVVSALGGNAAAGGVMLALAADEVWCRAGCVLNPHYRLMGLYGSEYWTYTLPRRVGATMADRLLHEALPVSAATARRLGLVDQVLECGPQDFTAEVRRLAARLAAHPGTRSRIAMKKSELDCQESKEPLAAFRERELARMHRIFHHPGAPYHALRRAFVRKETPSCTPPHLAVAASMRTARDPAGSRGAVDAAPAEGATSRPHD
ncbi:enoyl-CoA hydratase-related protein [Streptomyces glomeratus]|uniref:Hydrogenase maturation protein n=1 Tax=Streptomyces glomeratus TaxID=284452 RepID=A0ABP6LC40_9ACTN|nr:enoyl-CoA hydratase-related protein [Streptomyces glomeratus]MCF1508790.1 hydrogenase maturation protein [Streptomyces glomeratus]